MYWNTRQPKVANLNEQRTERKEKGWRRRRRRERRRRGEIRNKQNRKDKNT